jgi:pyrroloquinoline quinone (PQQ) biosynthesis protein C
MATQHPRDYGARRVYESHSKDGGALALHLFDRVVELGAKEATLYHALVDWLPTEQPEAILHERTGLDADALARAQARLADAGVLYRRSDVPDTVSGAAFYRDWFAPVLPSWLSQAFSHPFWDRMMSGKGSKRLFTGWLIELYHYTRNANRHMPLSCAHTREKPLKLMRAKHYAEEWNHYHYFMKSLKALGYDEPSIAGSVPLPMTLALSNFMRQAAREDILAYSICSAVLEGTTTDRSTYNPYYARCAELYGIPKEAIAPIYAHLDLDVKYQHSNLFEEILGEVESMPRARAARVLEYGHQLVEHIWLWTDSIERYYDNADAPCPRRPFDPVRE